MKKQTLAGLIIFCMGMVSGYGLSRINFYAKTKRGGKPGTHAAVQKLGKRLSLSRGQKESIRRILDSRKKDIQDLGAAVLPRYNLIRETVRQDIQTVLDENQRKQFGEMLQEAELKSPRLKEETESPGPLETSDKSNEEKDEQG